MSFLVIFLNVGRHVKFLLPSYDKHDTTSSMIQLDLANNGIVPQITIHGIHHV